MDKRTLAVALIASFLLGMLTKYLLSNHYAITVLDNGIVLNTNLWTGQSWISTTKWNYEWVPTLTRSKAFDSTFDD